MRVIAGSKRRLPLVTPKGLNTRPTSDQIKETLFNIINMDLYDVTFLDLFAGSGQIGIEALSRGASAAVFVESDKNALNCIEQNIKKCNLEESATIIGTDVFSALARMGGRKFDFVFMDPPYSKDIEKEVLKKLLEYELLTEDSTVIVEAALETEFDYLKDMGFTITREKCYKTNKHIFLALSNNK